MELFSIQCTTCRAKLKVTNEAAIGDILACPKCNSMVQVVPPVDWTRPVTSGMIVTEQVLLMPPGFTPSPSPNTASNKSKAAAAIPPALPLRPVEASAAEAVAGSIAGASPLPADLATAAPLPEMAAVAPPTIISLPMAPPIVEVTPVQNGLWSTLAARAKQDWMLLGSGLLGGIVLGSGMWLVLAMQPAPPSIVDDAAGQPPTSVAKVAALDPDAASRSRVAEPPAEPAKVDAAAKVEPPAADEPEVSPPLATAEVEPPATESSQTATVVPGDSPQGPKLKLEPVPTQSPTPPVAARPFPSDERQASVEAIERADESNSAPAVKDASEGLTRQALSGEEIEERFSRPLARVEFAKVPLAKFVEFIADFTGLTIVVDDAALAKLTKGRQTPVTIKLADTTAGAALRGSLAKLGLACTVRGGKVIVVVADNSAAAK